MKKNILGLDFGTNSIGWALIQQNFENKQREILEWEIKNPTEYAGLKIFFGF